MLLVIFIYEYLFYVFISINYYIGDWGLGIGDWAQSPIPNPQSPNIIYIIITNINTTNTN